MLLSQIRWYDTSNSVECKHDSPFSLQMDDVSTTLVVDYGGQAMLTGNQANSDGERVPVGSSPVRAILGHFQL